MVIKELLTKLKESILELLFPIKCVVCEKETYSAKKNKLICLDCFKTIRPSFELKCIQCLARTIDGGVCFACKFQNEKGINISSLRLENFLDSLIYPFSYSDWRVQKLIKAFKYKYIKDLAKPLSRILFIYLNKLNPKYFNLDKALIIPVPIFKRKLYRRGYNQSELLAGELHKNLKTRFPGIEFNSNFLIKIKSTPAQVDLNGADRLRGPLNSFRCLNPEGVKNRKILLVDDVYTTGATMQECAKVLRKAKAKEIIGLVIAKG